MKLNTKISVFFLYLTLIAHLIYAQDYNTQGSAVKFEFKHTQGDSSRILSTVNEDVFFNMNKDHSSVIINRITAKVTQVDEDGSGTLECNYMTTEDSKTSDSKAVFSFGEEYKSIFKRDTLGHYTISDEYFMPTVRDVPIFPPYEVKPGESWTSDGYEAHDLRRIFNYPKPYTVPFRVTYKYLGTSNINDKTVDVISAKYTMYMEMDQEDFGNQDKNQYDDYPVTWMGYSDELIYWDREKGAIQSYSEEFRIVIETSYGNMLEYKGTASAEITDFEQLDTEESLIDVQEKVDSMDISDVTVKKGEKGLVISLEDIKFKAESAELLDSEKIKLDKLAEILKSYPNNDLLVTGHTALAGTAESRQNLSELRAKAVADYLISRGVKDTYHIFTQGMGARQPLAPNNSEKNKAKNRRVEITILDE